MTQERVSFGSKLGMVLATAGSAVGLGNVWRFPYMAGDNGGAAFILIYIMCIMLLGIPCMMSEFIIGRHGAANTARAYSRMDTHKAWRFVGLMGVLTGFLITGYYAVVSGWCLQYIFASGVGELSGDPQYIASYFADFSASPVKPVFMDCGDTLYHPFHHCARRARRHRACVESLHADALRAAVGGGCEFVSVARRNEGRRVSLQARLLEGERQGVSRRNGSGVLLAGT